MREILARLILTLPCLLALAPAAASVEFPNSCGGFNYWWGGGTSNWFAASNWSSSSPPGTASNTYIFGAPFPAVTSGQAIACVVRVGATSGSGEIEIRMSGELTTRTLKLGGEAPYTGLVIVDGPSANLNVHGESWIGEEATSRMELLGGSQAQLNTVLVGPSPDSTLLVRGSGTRLQANRLNVFSNSSFELREGAELDLVTNLSISGTGSRAVIRDTNTRAEASILNISGSAAPQVILRGGSTLLLRGDPTNFIPDEAILGIDTDFSGTLRIGENSSSPGTLLTRKIASYGGDGTLEFDHHASDLMLLDQHGQATLLEGTLKLRHRGSGSTRITGPNVRDAWTWVHRGTLIFDGNLNSSPGQSVIVGDASGDDGNLHLVNSASFETLSGRIARVPGSAGEVLLSDGSSWTLEGTLVTGGGGDGLLRVQSGSAVSSGSGTIGNQSGSIGEVRVAGAESVWSVANSLVVGSQGGGQLSLRNGGLASVANGAGSVQLAEFSGSSGLLAIGNGQIPGVLDAQTVHGGIGAASVIFNHDSSSHAFRNAAGVPIGLSGSLALEHTGAGTTRLIGQHSHSGQTRVYDGRLTINGHFSHSPITVFEGGVLAGDLDSDQSVLVNSGGRLAPGDGAGWMALQSLNMLPNAQLNMQLGPAGTDHLEDQDLLIIDGSVSFLGTQLRVATLPNFSPGTHVLMQFTPGQLSSQSLLIEELPEGIDPNQTSLDWSVPGELRLHTVALPSAALLQMVPDELTRDFGLVTVNETSNLVEISIQSTGGSDLVISAVSIEGNQAAAFELDFESCTAAAIPTGQTCLLGLRFAPELAQDYSATLLIESNVIGGLHQVTLLGSGDGITPELAVNRQGQGVVSSQPAGIDCGETCSALFPHLTSVTLSATPSIGWRFGGWGGDCTGVLACEPEMSSDKIVEATFIRQRDLEVLVSGEGTVSTTPPAINCGAGGACVGSFDDNSFVALIASPSAGWVLSGWSSAGAACGNVSPCIITMDQNRTVGATFVRDTSALTITPRLLDFGSIPVGGTVNSLFFTIENPNSTTITISAITPAEAPFGDDGGDCPTPPFELASGASCFRAYSFSPSVLGDSAQVIEISGGGALPAVGTVTLTGSSLPGTRVLTVSRQGQGQVSSQPLGINCGESCQAEFDVSTDVMLTAQPAPDWVLVGWGGDAAGCGDSADCSITLNENLIVEAVFANAFNPILAVAPTMRDFNQVEVGTSSQPRAVSIGNPGSAALEVTSIGTVSAPFEPVGGTCATPPFTLPPGASCTREFSFTPIIAGPASTLFEISSNASTNAVRTVTLRGEGFQPQSNLTVMYQGQGAVTSSPAGIDCGDDCQAQFDRDSQITLTATPEPGWVLSTWGGVAAGCGNASQCSITLDQNRTVGALFVNAANPVLGVAPGLLNFRRVPVGSIEGALAVTIGNPGGDTLEITGIGEVSAPFEPAGGSCAAPPFVLAPGASCTLQFSFAPIETGPTSTEFEVTSNAPSNGTQTITLLGRGIQAQARLNLVRQGQGTITSDPAGIDCGIDREARFDRDSPVTLTANPAPGWVLSTWGAAGATCGNASQCTITLDQNRTVGALFEPTDDVVFSDRFQE